MRIGDLYDKFKGQPVYIIGAGPSLRVFPLDFLKGKVTIALNQSWRHLRTTYTLTVHPELLLDFEKEKASAGKDNERYHTQWIVKKKAPMADLSLDDKRYYVFNTKEEDYDVIRKRTPDTLFLAKGIQCTALDLAVRLGAKTIFLIGVDMGDLAGDHHGHDQHVRFHGLDPSLIYKEMRHHTAAVRRVIRDKFGVQVLTLSALLGAGAAEEDYRRLCQEFGLVKLPKPQDTSTYIRKPPKL